VAHSFDVIGLLRSIRRQDFIYCEEGNVLKSNCQKKCSNKLNQISSALNLTSQQLMFSEELFMLKSRLAQLHGAVRQFLDTGHEMTILLLLLMGRVEAAVSFLAWNKSVACVIK
jgi:hypothetical protein